jgi:cytochrome c peroxidase
MWNVGYHDAWYWDGRANSLEGQALAAWRGGNMGASGNDGAPSVEDVCATLDAVSAYGEQFQSVFGAACTPENVSMALAAFMRTIVTTSENTAWVRFRNGDTSALSEAAQRGYALFNEKAGCATCHSGLLLTDLQYHNVGVGLDADEPDLGRFAVTENEADRGAFKTPTLIDISKSAPYFHNGSVATLEEAVDQMLAGGIANPNLDVNIKPVELTPQERAELLEFLRALDATYTVAPPSLPQ